MFEFGELLRTYIKLRACKKGIKSEDLVFSGPFFVQVGPVDICNYSCVVCYPHSGSFNGNTVYANNKEEFKARGMINFSAFERLVGEYRKMDVRRLHLCGIGEPLLHPDILKIIACVKTAGLWCGLTTNGSLLDQNKINELARLGLDSLHVSINAADDDTYRQITLPKTDIGLGNLKHNILQLRTQINKNKKQLPQLSLGFVLFNKNYLQIPAMVEFAIQVGADEVVFKGANLEAETQHLALTTDEYEFAIKTISQIKKKIKPSFLHYDDFKFMRNSNGNKVGISVYKNIRCYIGWFFSRVLANGDIIPCCSRNRVLGNIYKSSFKEIWYSQNYNSFRKEASRLGRDIDNVFGCNCQQCGNVLHNLQLNRILRYIC